MLVAAWITGHVSDVIHMGELEGKVMTKAWGYKCDLK